MSGRGKTPHRRGPRALLRIGILGALLAAGVAPAVAAQEAGEAPSPSDRLGWAKWSGLAVSAGLTGLGFFWDREADDLFADLEALCLADEEACRRRNDDGSFADPELERRFQEVVDYDDRARWALVLGQVGLAASVVLFILDLDESGPPDIPYLPPARLRSTLDGRSTLEFRIPVGGG